ncbi:hypothetical protein EYC84_000624 [Monilinia fructicola]|uniref:MOSC domain-containing protein n=1 Tax=Monilinia fructicola TaxID=38448 RepID=A0A5M9JP80_MONFR|nr:hypothetical protein EYC84_000624 [Monilinia fructicola]
MTAANTSLFGGMETTEALLGNLMHLLDIQLFREVPVPFLGEVPLAKIIILVCTLVFINTIGILAKKIQHKQEKVKYEESMAREEVNSSAPAPKVSGPKMTISQLYVYPIKSLRGCSLPSATLTKEGFSHDRKFMLLRVHEQDSKWGRYQNMHITHFPQMALFHTSIHGPNLRVTYHAPGSSQSPSEERPTLEIELAPSTFSNLPKLTVNMHGSATTAHDMGPKCNEWFSRHFGFPVVLAHTGNNRRLVLGNLPNRPATQGPEIPSPAAKLLQYIPLVGPSLAPPPPGTRNHRLQRLRALPHHHLGLLHKHLAASPPAHQPRHHQIPRQHHHLGIHLIPVVIFSLSLTPPKIHLTANCGRCISLNVDHETGSTAPPNEGMLKLLMSDRRVDPGTKYSPVFGRYGFVARGDEGQVLRVGDAVSVSRRNEARTRFYWPGLST